MATNQVVESIKDNLIKLAERGVVTYLVAAFPIFATPILNYLLTMAVRAIISIAVKKTELGIFFIQVDHATKEQAAEYLKSIEKLDNAKNEEERKKAELEFIEKTKNLIKFGKH